jgi:hypothetical protein
MVALVMLVSVVVVYALSFLLVRESERSASDAAEGSAAAATAARAVAMLPAEPGDRTDTLADCYGWTWMIRRPVRHNDGRASVERWRVGHGAIPPPGRLPPSRHTAPPHARGQRPS